ncbi:hypothetical protein VKT23_012815 [Stygiomarasmius scandens]|uniref:Uncharacterized protein n=1 Tax=Marasmiellus scandens TaxID=2682957 RepID=A0ABR1J5S8_9AGAR
MIFIYAQQAGARPAQAVSKNPHIVNVTNLLRKNPVQTRRSNRTALREKVPIDSDSDIALTGGRVQGSPSFLNVRVKDDLSHTALYAVIRLYLPYDSTTAAAIRWSSSVKRDINGVRPSICQSGREPFDEFFKLGSVLSSASNSLHSLPVPPSFGRGISLGSVNWTAPFDIDNDSVNKFRTEPEPGVTGLCTRPPMVDLQTPTPSAEPMPASWVHKSLGRWPDTWDSSLYDPGVTRVTKFVAGPESISPVSLLPRPFSLVNYGTSGLSVVACHPMLGSNLMVTRTLAPQIPMSAPYENALRHIQNTARLNDCSHRNERRSHCLARALPPRRCYEETVITVPDLWQALVELRPCWLLLLHHDWGWSMVDQRRRRNLTNRYPQLEDDAADFDDQLLVSFLISVSSNPWSQPPTSSFGNARNFEINGSTFTHGQTVNNAVHNYNHCSPTVHEELMKTIEDLKGTISTSETRQEQYIRLLEATLQSTSSYTNQYPRILDAPGPEPPPNEYNTKIETICLEIMSRHRDLERKLIDRRRDLEHRLVDRRRDLERKLADQWRDLADQRDSGHELIDFQRDLEQDMIDLQRNLEYGLADLKWNLERDLVGLPKCGSVDWQRELQWDLADRWHELQRDLADRCRELQRDLADRCRELRWDPSDRRRELANQQQRGRWFIHLFYMVLFISMAYILAFIRN